MARKAPTTPAPYRAPAWIVAKLGPQVTEDAVDACLVEAEAAGLSTYKSHMLALEYLELLVEARDEVTA